MHRATHHIHNVCSTRDAVSGDYVSQANIKGDMLGFTTGNKEWL